MKKLAAFVVLIGGTLAGITFLPSRFRKQPATHVLKVSGNIETHESDLSFKVQGRLKDLLIQEGQWVEQGAVLARLDDDDSQQQVASDEATLQYRQAELSLTEAGSRTHEIKAAENSLADAEADLELKKLDFKRNQDLYAKDAVSAETRDISATNLKRAQAAYERQKQLYEEMLEGSRKEQIAIDRQAVKQAYENLRLSRIRLGYTVLRAPTSGVIVTREAEPGEVVGPGTPIVTLADVNDVWLRAYVNETDLGRVHWGDSAVITSDTYPGKKYYGKLSFIASDAEFTPKSVQTQGERVTLVYKIKIDVPNGNHELKPGMPADAVLQPGPVQAAAPSAPVVPANTAVAAGTPPPPALVRTASHEPHDLEMEGVRLREREEGTQIEITGVDVVRPRTMHLKDPDRIVIDLPNTRWKYPPRMIHGQATDVRSVRIAQFSVDPPVTRVVVDLGVQRSYQLVSRDSGLDVLLRSPGRPHGDSSSPKNPSPR